MSVHLISISFFPWRSSRRLSWMIILKIIILLLTSYFLISVLLCALYSSLLISYNLMSLIYISPIDFSLGTNFEIILYQWRCRGYSSFLILYQIFIIDLRTFFRHILSLLLLYSGFKGCLSIRELGVLNRASHTDLVLLRASSIHRRAHWI